MYLLNLNYLRLLARSRVNGAAWLRNNSSCQSKIHDTIMTVM